MAQPYIIDDPVVTIDGDDLSGYFSSVAIEASFEEVPATPFGADFNVILIGLGDATMTFDAFQDHGAGALDQLMWPIFKNKTAVEVSVRPTSAVISATNPEYSLPAAVLTTYNPIAGSKGEASTMPLTFRNSGQLGLVKSYS